MITEQQRADTSDTIFELGLEVSRTHRVARVIEGSEQGHLKPPVTVAESGVLAPSQFHDAFPYRLRDRIERSPSLIAIVDPRGVRRIVLALQPLHLPLA